MAEQHEQHALRRTSPKGGPFVGVCTRCGKENVTLDQIAEECPNIRGISSDDALIELIKDESN